MEAGRIVFFGTPEFAVPCLEILKKNILLVVTQPDQPAGRGKKIASPPVKKYCEENNIPCIQPTSIKTDGFLQKIKEIKPDLFIIVAYGKLFPRTLLDVCPLSINVHASLLPRWRGASPIAQAIYHQDASTGVSIMKLVEAMDAGPVMLQKEIPIAKDDDTATLSEKLSKLGADALLESVQMIKNNHFTFVDQDERKVTLAPKLLVEEAKINWNKSALENQHHIRAYAPSPGAFAYDGLERIKIFKSIATGESVNVKPGTLKRQKKQLCIACKDEWLELVELQRPGKKRQSIVDFLNGYSPERTQWN